MTVRNDISVDWASSPRIITVDAPSTEITIQDLVDTLRELEDEPPNMTFDHLINAAGKEDLGGGVRVGITATLQNAKLAFEARPGPSYAQCQISGGNLVAVDSNGDTIDPVQTTAFTQIVRTSSSSATLQELADIQYSSFNGGVTVDVVNGTSGTTYPTGTPRQPVDNLADAASIASTRGFTTFFIIGNLTLGSGDTLDGFTFLGQGHSLSDVTINAAANVTNCTFRLATVSGELDGDCAIHDCNVGTLTYVSGHMETCVISGTITLGNASPVNIMDCWSGTAGAPFPILDLGGSGQTLVMRNYNGGVTLKNKTGSETTAIDLNSGHVTIDSDVTAGTVIIRGVGEVTDNSVGATVDTTGLLSGTEQQFLVDCAEADEELTNTTATKKHKTTKAVLVQKNVTGAVGTNITLTE